MPDKSAELLDAMGVEAAHRSYNYATWGSDLEYGTPKFSLAKKSWDGLFPPLAVET